MEYSYLDYLGDLPDILDDDLELIDIIEVGLPRRIYSRPNYFEEMEPPGFFRRFRLYKETVLHVLSQLDDQLEYHHDRNHSISPMNQLLCC
ncbi:unnamed protein product [Acanthoscelides obtectus]|uniref:Uncharacterized protein n=1 Tax=Acanthoscelides obtectus TaxID=200917 RepID=A0A9P0PVA0_ACAOB|nr:unnamed protein product [Acanthoscelides obtectus]CAH1998444.1 unnamed protein product [Acanthoscelides obtectus]CAK1680295.1 hypothetical protein AOBTE_LOCUS32565 [Acanthoscelides obtectus]CAK1680357.1 hypothetical protein AOBTE_LOCUS32594 [Acanthoscelides obtectus]